MGQSRSAGVQERHLAKSPKVTRLLAVLGIEEGLDQIPSHGGTNGAAAHAEDIHVIILNALLGGEVIMDEAGADALGFIGADRGPHPAATDGDAALDLACHESEGHRGDEVGIVVVMAELVGTEVDDFVTGGLELGDQLFFQFKSAVIGCKSYAHWETLVFHPGKARGKNSL